MIALRILLVIGFVLVIVLVAGFVGCEHKPNIPGFHWRGSDLYNTYGTQVASVVVFPFGINSSQACVFQSSGLRETGCTYWETGQQAYDYIDKVFREKK